MLFVAGLFSTMHFAFCTIGFVIGSLNIEEFKSLNYEVDILNIPVKVGEERNLPVIFMTSKYGQNYECLLPRIETREENSDFSESNTIENNDIKSLLQPLQNAPCLIKTKDWWTYEFCYGHYIKQYHVEDSNIVGNVITLGIYDSDFDWDNETNREQSSENHQKRYHSQFYNNGTKCDLTGLPRNAEIRFVCEEELGDYIYRVDEPGTCSYLITVHTPRICKHPYLKPLPSNKPQVISCSPLLNSEEYQIYIEKVEEEKRMAEEKRKAWLAEQQERLKKLKSWAHQQRLRLEQEKLDEELKKDKAETQAYDTITTDRQSQLENPIESEITLKEENEESVIEVMNGEITEDHKILENLEKDLPETTKEEQAVVSSYKKDIQKEISKQFNELIEEAEEELQNEMDADIHDATFSKLATTLNKLIEKLDKAEREVATVTKELEKAKDTMIHNEKKNDGQATDDADNELKVLDNIADDYSDEILNSDDVDDTKDDSNGENGKLRVRIRRLGQGKQSKGKLQLLHHHGLEGKQKEKLEKAVKEKLEQAGLDTNGRRIEVKIITAGYYDDEEGKDFHVLSDEETQQFQSMILTLLTRNQEAVQEMERQQRIEKNYRFTWENEENEE